MGMVVKAKPAEMAKSVGAELTGAAWRPEVPSKDRTVKPWRSVVHWREMHRAPRMMGGAMRQAWAVPVTCGSCGKRRDVSMWSALAPGFTGRCYKCSRQKPAEEYPTEVQTLPDTGSIIHWPEVFAERVVNKSRTRIRKYVPVTCGRCLFKRPVYVFEVRTPDFMGYCLTCSKIKYLKDVTLPDTGSIVHWSECVREHLNRRVPVTCGKCGLKREVAASNIGEGYTGLCIPCRKQNADVTLKDGPGATDGTRILYSQEDERGQVPVVYHCGCRRMVPRLNIRKKYPRLCRRCLSDTDGYEERLAARLRAEMAANSTRGGDGHQVDPLAVFVELMFDIACEIYDRRDRLGDVTAKAVACALDQRGGVGRRQMDNKLRAAGYPDWNSFAVDALKKRGRL